MCSFFDCTDRDTVAGELSKPSMRLTNAVNQATHAMSSTVTLIALGISIAIPWACSEEQTKAGPIEIVDSAGIAIVINERAPGGLARWRTEPILTIGELTGPEEYSLGRIADVDVDQHGQVFVLDAQAQQGMVYGPDGRFRFRFGGPGEGPGELSEQVTSVRVGPFDSIAVLDFWQMRLNMYDPAGAPARTLPLRFGRQGPYQFHWLPDGRLLVRWFNYNVDAEGRFVPWDVLLMSNPAQTSFDTVMSFDYRPPNLGGVDRILRPILTNAAFYDVLAGGMVVWSDLEKDHLAIDSLDGSLKRIVRNRGWQRRSLTSADRGALEALYRARSHDSDQALPDDVVFPDSIPTITAIRASPDGGFWVQRMGPLSEVDPAALFLPAHQGWLGGTTWEVYDKDGGWNATVEVPRRFRVTQVLDSTVVGVHRDEMDVERVVLLRIVR
jgi:hypothetical protein